MRARKRVIMSRQTLAVVDNREVPVAVAQPAPARRPWHQSRWYQVLWGCGVAVIVFWQLSRMLMLLTGTTNYGTLLKVNHADLYYTSAVSQEEAKALGAFLVKTEVFDGRHMSTQLTRDGQTTRVRFPVKASARSARSDIRSP
jgi:hypothetical protein